MKILVTGAAGFIGFYTTQRLLAQGHAVVGLDNLNEYYDVNLKLARLEELKKNPGFTFYKMDLADRAAVAELFAREKFERVVHLAAQAGVRYSIEHPEVYVDSNLVGFGNILEGCRHSGVGHLLFASTSSVAGLNKKFPFSAHDIADHPMTLYAASKRANELMAHTYSHLFGLPCTGVRFFTVYGPFGRPDMALFKFTKSILADEPIEVYNNGEMIRDWTFVDDTVTGVVKMLDSVPTANPSWDASHPDPATSSAPFRLYNLGGGKPETLAVFLAALETALGKKAQKKFLPIQAGDVERTEADVTDIVRDFNFKPEISVEEGVRRFVDWYRAYYKI